MNAKIKHIDRIGDLIEVVAEVDGEEKRVRRNVQNYDELSDRQKQTLHRDILGIPEVIEVPTNFLQKVKAIFTHKVF